jgi:hypothetical protein
VTTAPPRVPERRPAVNPSREQTRAAVRDDPPPVARTPVIDSQAAARQAAARLDSIARAESTRVDTPAAPPANVVAPSPPVERPAATPDPVISDSTLIARAVQSYAQAIESRDVNAVRGVYPGLSAAQRQGFQQFFDATRSVDVTLAITRLSISDASADASVAGTYVYETSRGGIQRDPVSFTATLRKDGNAWRFVSVR